MFLTSPDPFTNSLKQLLGLHGRKHKRDDPVFPQRRDILKGIVPYQFKAQKELKKAPER
jgi:hypothetical protein